MDGLGDGWGMAEAVRRGEVTATQLVEDALARIAERDPEINAFTIVLDDDARQAARAADELVRDFRAVPKVDADALPPLLGVPVSVKDHIWLADAP
ncbi:MAG TPA: amidase family protein, partial [Nocardioidaceae bacterium]